MAALNSIGNTWIASTCCLIVLVGAACRCAGMMYYGDLGESGERPSDFVTELHSQEDLDNFIHAPDQDDKVLTVIDVSLTGAGPCIHIFPAVLALAKNFKGFARFARLMGDASPAMQEIIQGLNVIEVCSHLDLTLLFSLPVCQSGQDGARDGWQ